MASGLYSAGIFPLRSDLQIQTIDLEIDKDNPQLLKLTDEHAKDIAQIFAQTLSQFEVKDCETEVDRMIHGFRVACPRMELLADDPKQQLPETESEDIRSQILGLVFQPDVVQLLCKPCDHAQPSNTLPTTLPSMLVQQHVCNPAEEISDAISQLSQERERVTGAHSTLSYWLSFIDHGASALQSSPGQNRMADFILAMLRVCCQKSNEQAAFLMQSCPPFFYQETLRLQKLQKVSHYRNLCHLMLTCSSK
jgi:hypothetical protein